MCLFKGRVFPDQENLEKLFVVDDKDPLVYAICYIQVNRRYNANLYKLRRVYIYTVFCESSVD